MIRGIKIIACFILLASCNKEAVRNELALENFENPVISSEEGFAEIPSELSSVDLIEFVEDRNNPYTSEKKIGDISYRLQYKPVDYIIALENMDKGVTETEKNARIDEIKDLDYFTLRISADNFNQELLKYKLESEEEYYSRLQYFMDEMQKDIYIKCGNDSLPCVLYHFERTFGIAPYASFSLGFEKSANKNDRVFVFEDRIFGGGKIKIQLPARIFSEYPELKTE